MKLPLLIVLLVGLMGVNSEGPFTCKKDMDYTKTDLGDRNYRNGTIEVIWKDIFTPKDEKTIKKCISSVTLWSGGDPNSKCCEEKDGWKMQQREPIYGDFRPFRFETCRSRKYCFIKIEIYEPSIKAKWHEPQMTEIVSRFPIPRCYEDVPLAEDLKVSDKDCILTISGLGAFWIVTFVCCGCCLCKKKNTQKTSDTNRSSQLSEVISQDSWRSTKARAGSEYSDNSSSSYSSQPSSSYS